MFIYIDFPKKKNFVSNTYYFYVQSKIILSNQKLNISSTICLGY